MTARKVHLDREWRDLLMSSDATPPMRFVGVVMSFPIDFDTMRTRVGANTIASRTGYSIRTVRYAIEALTAGGWLIQIERGGFVGHRSFTSTYALAMPCISCTTPVQLTTVSRATDDREPCISCTPSPKGSPRKDFPEGEATPPGVVDGASAASAGARREGKGAPKKKSYSPRLTSTQKRNQVPHPSEYDPRVYDANDRKTS